MNNINKIFITFLCIELIIGGGGRLLEPLGIFPLRYLLFVFSFILLIFNLVTFNFSITQKCVSLFIWLLLFPFYGFFVGLLAGNKINDILFDVQPYLFMLSLIYLFTLRYTLKVFSCEIFIKIVNAFALYGSLLYISYIILLNFGLLNFNLIYEHLSLTSEFFFRPDGAFFSKSFYFFGVGAIISFVDKKYLKCLIIVLAILLTESRGVLLFTTLSLLLASFKLHKLYLNTIIIILGSVLFIIMLYMVGSRSEDSDSVRFNDLYFYYKNVDLATFLFGRGFGSFILDRLRIEIVPLEILQKTGIIGVFISLVPMLLIFLKGYFLNSTKTSLMMSLILFFSITVSITNPFLFTPMGIFIIGVVVLWVFSIENIQISNNLTSGAK
ncbi:TPA: O13/O129/O135 family O-antigen polymerase [Shigella flexneri]|nr:O13/O129/O135 family O-antigen polymerase [Shigella flexneri]